MRTLQGKLLEKKRIGRKHLTTYIEPKEALVEKFDFYGFSAVAPVVPPLDLSWANDNDNKPNTKKSRPLPQLPVEGRSSNLAAFVAVETKSKFPWYMKMNKKMDNSTVTPEETVEKFRPLPVLPTQSSKTANGEVVEKNQTGAKSKKTAIQVIAGLCGKLKNRLAAGLKRRSNKVGCQPNQ